MKKVLAILLVAVIATSASFAGSWSSGPLTGTFTATVYCQPSLVPGSTTYFAGNFFQTDSYTGAPDVLNWTLTGPDGAYVITMSGAVTSGTGATWNVTFSHNGTYDGTDDLGFANDCSISEDLKAYLNGITFSGASTGLHQYTVTVSVTATI